MFLSGHDFEVVLLVCLVAGVVAVAFALAVGRRVVRGSRALQRRGPPVRRERRVRRRRRRPGRARRSCRTSSRAPASGCASRGSASAGSEESRRELVAWVSHDLRTPAGRAARDDRGAGGRAGRGPRALPPRRCAPRWTGWSGWSTTSSSSPGSTPACSSCRCEPVALGDLVSEAIAGGRPGRPRAPASGSAAGSSRARRCSADPAGLSRVVANLVMNAIRHTPGRRRRRDHRPRRRRRRRAERRRRLRRHPRGGHGAGLRRRPGRGVPRARPEAEPRPRHAAPGSAWRSSRASSRRTAARCRSANERPGLPVPGPAARLSRRVRTTIVAAVTSTVTTAINAQPATYGRSSRVGLSGRSPNPPSTGIATMVDRPEDDQPGDRGARRKRPGPPWHPRPRRPRTSGASTKSCSTTPAASQIAALTSWSRSCRLSSSYAPYRPTATPTRADQEPGPSREHLQPADPLGLQHPGPVGRDDPGRVAVVEGQRLAVERRGPAGCGRRRRSSPWRVVRRKAPARLQRGHATSLPVGASTRASRSRTPDAGPRRRCALQPSTQAIGSVLGLLLHRAQLVAGERDAVGRRDATSSRYAGRRRDLGRPGRPRGLVDRQALRTLAGRGPRSTDTSRSQRHRVAGGRRAPPRRRRPRSCAAARAATAPGSVAAGRSSAVVVDVGARVRARMIGSLTAMCTTSEPIATQARA